MLKNVISSISPSLLTIDESTSLTEDQVKQTQLTIATFNLFNYLSPPDAYYDFDRIYSSEQWQKKERWIASYLRSYAPDIVGFQEVFSINALAELTKAQGYAHFAVIDEPTVVDDFIYRDPVVALASKFPIKEVATVPVDIELALKLGLTADFNFSRQVLRATVEFPHLGLCDCYVVHFKSKRAAWQSEADAQVSLEGNVIEQFKAQVAGGWASSIQRGSEATLLMMSMIERRAKLGNAMVLMGDFNNPLQDGVLAHLTTPKLMFNNDQSQQRLANFYVLRDAWELYRINQEADQQIDVAVPLKRGSTHYFGQGSSVLDYILLSSEFDATAQSSYFEVSDYINTDKHLINPIFDIDGESTDHAIVSIKLSLRE